MWEEIFSYLICAIFLSIVLLLLFILCVNYKYLFYIDRYMPWSFSYIYIYIYIYIYSMISKFINQLKPWFVVIVSMYWCIC
jgi:hypothetical protein